jgi:divalent metal cation (Fe/Co/Zn/Cd) transporter
MGFLNAYADVRTGITVVIMRIIAIIFLLVGILIFRQPVDPVTNPNPKKSGSITIAIGLAIYFLAGAFGGYERSLGKGGKQVLGSFELLGNIGGALRRK